MRLKEYYKKVYCKKFKNQNGLIVRIIGCYVTIMFFISILFAAIYDTLLFLLEIPLLILISLLFNFIALLFERKGLWIFHPKDVICDWLYFIDKIGVE